MWDTSHRLIDAETEISNVTFKICSNEKLRKMRYVPENDDAVVGIMGEPSHRFKEGAIYVLSKAEIT